MHDSPCLLAYNVKHSALLSLHLAPGVWTKVLNLTWLSLNPRHNRHQSTLLSKSFLFSLAFNKLSGSGTPHQTHLHIMYHSGSKNVLFCQLLDCNSSPSLPGDGCHMGLNQIMEAQHNHPHANYDPQAAYSNLCIPRSFRWSVLPVCLPPQFQLHI